MGVAFAGSRFRIIVGNHRSFERFIVVAIFEIRDDRFGGEPMADRVAARTPFAFLRSRPGTLEGVQLIGFYLLQ